MNAFSKLLQPILGAPVWALVILVLAMAVATLIGGPIFGSIAVIIFGLLVIYGIAWFLSFVVGKMAQSFATELNLARIEVTDAIKNVVASCPEQCRGDISPPDCKLE
jgi:ABC-type transport system involved in cytochrome bd biosynthesis fused ATPase/permease subunit